MEQRPLSHKSYSIQCRQRVFDSVERSDGVASGFFDSVERSDGVAWCCLLCDSVAPDGVACVSVASGSPLARAGMLRLPRTKPAEGVIWARHGSQELRFLGNDVPLKRLQSFTNRLLQSEHFQLREGGGRFLGNDGPLKLLQSFTTRLLQSEHFQPRKIPKTTILLPGRVGGGSWEMMVL